METPSGIIYMKGYISMERFISIILIESLSRFTLYQFRMSENYFIDIILLDSNYTNSSDNSLRYKEIK